MKTHIEQITLPKFIHCENEPKIGDFIHDNRQFIYCPEYLSLIEIIPLNDYQIQYSMDQYQKTFLYTSELYGEEEEYLLVFVQNNIELFNQTREIEILQGVVELMTSEKLIDEAWNYYLTYLIWEDK